MTKNRWWSDAPYREWRRPYRLGFGMAGAGAGLAGHALYRVHFDSDYDSSSSNALISAGIQVGLVFLVIGLALLVAGWAEHRPTRDSRRG